MSRKENFHDLFARVPEVIWQALKKEAAQQQRTATGQLIFILAERYKIKLQTGPKLSERKPL